ncbi:MAG: hypothetical protein ACPG7F_02535 [Aggregatilineales bacterium]
MNSIATLHQLRLHLGFAAEDTAEDARLQDMLESASALITRTTHREFMPRRATIPHEVHLYDPTELILSEDVLELTALYNGTGDSIDIDSDVVVIASSVLHLINGSFVYEDTPLNAIQVQGIWGWHDDWSNAWVNSADTVQDNPLSDSATTLTVTDADGTNSIAHSPRFQVGQLLKIAEEYLRVLAIDTATNTLTVQRGVNGTTAAEHTTSTIIYIYHPPLDAMNLCLRLATWLYREPDGYVGDELPRVIWRMLNRLRRLKVA